MTTRELNLRYYGLHLIVEYQGNQYTSYSKTQFWTNSKGIICLDVNGLNSAIPFSECKIRGVKND